MAIRIARTSTPSQMKNSGNYQAQGRRPHIETCDCLPPSNERELRHQQSKPTARKCKATSVCSRSGEPHNANFKRPIRATPRLPNYCHTAAPLCVGVFVRSSIMRKFAYGAALGNSIVRKFGFKVALVSLRPSKNKALEYKPS